MLVSKRKRRNMSWLGGDGGEIVRSNDWGISVTKGLAEKSIVYPGEIPSVSRLLAGVPRAGGSTPSPTCPGAYDTKLRIAERAIGAGG